MSLFAYVFTAVFAGIMSVYLAAFVIDRLYKRGHPILSAIVFSAAIAAFIGLLVCSLERP